MHPSPAATSLVQAFLAAGSLPLSRSINKVQAMLGRGDYNACDLAEHLRLDPLLATRVMAVANSAFFSRHPCGTIDEAVNRLGTAQLTRIFAQVLANSALVHPLRAYALPADALWRRSLLAAVAAELAAGRKGEDRASAYMVGLLHLIGLLVIEKQWEKSPGAGALQLRDFEREWSADEKKLCGCDHAVLGAELLRQLAFPAALVSAVERQYLPPFEPHEQCLYVGRIVRSTLCDTVPVNPHQEIMREFKLAADSQLEAFIADTREETQRLMQAAA